ncbi:uncharacterized protein C8A04DRAFT_30116 [Dichotomopilus funicola]|uniref:Uncharacterized protein n=1 Tax=Dichotomopilus funicola TaxID=1934379 RepID=A0AAN6UZY3_9PEZI|nr:hypothetical protein C8A04DRAFT_30116 [Dichotomopilus funicola]
MAAVSPEQDVVSRYEDIVRTGTVFARQIDSNEKWDSSAPGNDAVFASFDEFADRNRRVLDILINKAGPIENLSAIGGRVATTLDQVKDTYHTITANIAALSDGLTKDMKLLGDSLENLVTLAIQKYSGRGTQKRAETFSA